METSTVNSSSSFILEEVTEKYHSLKSQHENVCRQYASVQQELHDLKRNHQCVSELNDHLTSEVEALQKNEKKIIDEWTDTCKMLRVEMDQLREEKWKESENFTNTIHSLEHQISKIKQNSVVPVVVTPVSQLDDTKVIEEIRMYEEQIAGLKDANLELKNTLTEALKMNELHTVEVESLKEQVECLRSNLSTKKEELSTATDMLHSAQEDLCSASAEIQQLKSQTTTYAAKGNSLFAEVDDKRQEMLKSMSQMKDKVYQLNREVVSRQAKIDALLCEKKTLWEEYSGQSNHHDAALFKAYERRITELEKQTYQLSREIARWFDKNIDPSSSEAAQWLSGVLEHYRKENSRLTIDLTAASVNNLSIEQKLRELQRQIVTWRTKVMESRATASELETKLQLAERTLQNVTNLNATSMDETKLVKPAADLDQSRVDPNNTTLPRDCTDINLNEGKSRSVIAKENIRPGILTSGGNENKIPKKASFV